MPGETEALPRVSQWLVFFCFGEDDTAVQISALDGFIFTGDEGERTGISGDDAVQPGQILFIDFFVRVNLKDLHIIVRIKDNDTVSDLNRRDAGKGACFICVQMISK